MLAVSVLSLAIAVGSVSGAIIKRQDEPESLIPFPVPEACAEPCSAIAVFAGATPDYEAGCTETVMTSLGQCLTCSVEATPEVFTEEVNAGVEAALTALVGICASEGIEVTPPTFTPPTGGDDTNTDETTPGGDDQTTESGAESTGSKSTNSEASTTSSSSNSTESDPAETTTDGAATGLKAPSALAALFAVALAAL